MGVSFINVSVWFVMCVHIWLSVCSQVYAFTSFFFFLIYLRIWLLIGFKIFTRIPIYVGDLATGPIYFGEDFKTYTGIRDSPTSSETYELVSLIGSQVP